MKDWSRKKLSILLTIALSSSTAIADGFTDNFDHFYTGIGLGYDSLAAKRHEVTAASSSYGTSTTDDSMNTHGLLLNLVAGHGWSFNHIYTGIEANLYGSNNKGCNNTYGTFGGNNYSDKDCLKESFGISLQGQVGYLANQNTLYYLGLGPIVSRFKIDQSSQFTTQANASTQTDYRYATGVQAAIGTTWQVSKPLALKAEYVYSAYPSISVPEINNNQLSYREIKDSEGHLDLLYYFG